MNALKIVFFSIVILAVLIELIYIYYKITISKCERESKETKKELSSLISSIAPYEKFEKVSKESLVPNSPIRVDGDYMDFIVDSISEIDKGIEKSILKII